MKPATRWLLFASVLSLLAIGGLITTVLAPSHLRIAGELLLTAGTNWWTLTR